MERRNRIVVGALTAVLTAASGAADPARAELAASRPAEASDHERLAELDAQLASARMIERLEAVQALGGLALSGLGGAVERLDRARADESWTVARQAEAAMARRNGGQILPAEIVRLHRSALAAAEVEEVTRELSAASPITRLRAVQAASALLAGDTPGYASRLRELLATASSDEDRRVAAQAAAALERLAGGPGVDPERRRQHRLRTERQEVDECEAELGSGAPIRRLEAVQRLAALVATAIEPERASALLAAALGDPDFRVAAQARHALDRLNLESFGIN